MPLKDNKHYHHIYFIVFKCLSKNFFPLLNNYSEDYYIIMCNVIIIQIIQYYYYSDCNFYNYH